MSCANLVLLLGQILVTAGQLYSSKRESTSDAGGIGGNALRFDSQDLQRASPQQLKMQGRDYREGFLNKLKMTIHGTIRAPPELFGQTLGEERQKGGFYLDEGDSDTPKVEHMVDNCDARLFGGAQYWRAMQEFRCVVAHMKHSPVTEEEVCNAAGVDEYSMMIRYHDGIDYMRTACVVAVEKARDWFQPLIERLSLRCEHIMRRLCPVIDHIVNKDGQGAEHAGYRHLVEKIYLRFLEEAASDVRRRCRDDVRAMTKYVTWNANTVSRADLRRMLSPIASDFCSRDNIMAGHISEAKASGMPSHQSGQSKYLGGKGGSQLDIFDPKNMAPAQVAQETLIQFLEDTVWNRNLKRCIAMINTLVEHIINGWRDYFAQTVEFKFNCFFLMTFINKFPNYLRTELEDLFDNEDSLKELLAKSVGEASLTYDNQAAPDKRLSDKMDDIETEVFGS